MKTANPGGCCCGTSGYYGCSLVNAGPAINGKLWKQAYADIPVPGSAVNLLSLSGGIFDLDVDLFNGYIFYTSIDSSGNGFVGRCLLDGSSNTTIYSWSAWQDGTSSTTFFGGAAYAVSPIAVDTVNERVYFYKQLGARRQSQHLRDPFDGL